MKSLQSPVKALLLLIPLSGLLFADEQSQTSNESSSVKKSVTVTSDGNQTIKKTTITEDGKTRTITEITDAAGNTRVVEGEKEPMPEEKKEPEVWLGLKARKASAALRGQLGLRENEGLVVEVLANGGPAAKADIQVNDLLLSMDEDSLGTSEELDLKIKGKKAGETANFEVMRKGKRNNIEVTLENRPQSQQKKSTNNTQRNGNGDRAFDEILSDPNVPESFKKKVREMQRRQKEFMEKHKINLNKLPKGGNTSSTGGSHSEGGSESYSESHRESSSESFSDGGKAFDAILSNPNLSEDFKKRIKEMQRRQKEQREKRKAD